MKQFGVLSQRYFTLIRNDRQRILMIVVQPVVIAFLLVLVANGEVFEIYEPTKSILFTLSCSGIWIGIFNSIQEICKERNILRREYFANVSLIAYVGSKFFVQCVISVVQSVIFTVIFILFVGSPEKGLIFGSPYIEMAVTMFLTIYASCAVGFVFSALSKNNERAMTTAPFLLIIQLLFSGILFELGKVTKAISYFTVSRWSVEAFGSVSDLNALGTLLQRELPAAVHEAEEIFEHNPTHLFRTWGVLLTFAVISMISSIIILKNITKDSK